MRQLPREVLEYCLRCRHMKSSKAGVLYCNARTCPKKKVRDKVRELKEDGQ